MPDLQRYPWKYELDIIVFVSFTRLFSSGFLYESDFRIPIDSKKERRKSQK